MTEGERALTEVIARLDHLRGEHEQRRTAHLEQMRQAAGLASETSVLESQATAAEAVRQRSRDRIAELDRQLAALAAELDRLRRRATNWRSAPSRRKACWPAAKQDLANRSSNWPRGRTSWPACSSVTARRPNGPPCSKNWNAARRASARA